MENNDLTKLETLYLEDMMDDRGIDCDDIDTIIKVLRERIEETSNIEIAKSLLEKMLKIKEA